MINKLHFSFHIDSLSSLILTRFAFDLRLRITVRVVQFQRTPVLVVGLARAHTVDVVGQAELGLQAAPLVIQGRAQLLVVTADGTRLLATAVWVIGVWGALVGGVHAGGRQEASQVVVAVPALEPGHELVPERWSKLNSEITLVVLGLNHGIKMRLLSAPKLGDSI